MLVLTQTKTLADLAKLAVSELSEQLAKMGASNLAPPISLNGPGETQITALAAFNEAGPGVLTFAVSGQYLDQAQQRGAAAVIVPPALNGDILKIPALVTSEPRLVFAALLGCLGKPPRSRFENGEPFFVDRASVTLSEGAVLGAQAYIGQKVKIGRNSVVAPGAYLEDGVEIGDDCLIHPRAVLRWGVKVGHRCQIHAGAVIGGDGFGYTQMPDLEHGRLIHYKNEHLGGVVIEDDVEIGSQSTIDRGLVSDTIIKRGTKIDNLVQIGHNCLIGQDCIVVSQTGIGGHSVIGDRAFLLGQTGLGPGVNIGNDAVLTGQTGVGSGSVPAGRKMWSGTPAKPNDEVYKNMALSYSQLPKVRKFFQLFKKCRSFEELKEAFWASGNREEKKQD